ncbi:unnamed protein product [Larinioides sclopetarius]|uniref:Uncharacterized protein n=1 Tax=Larinioides sclopetarius TaxID=280406 RepID=A0AAV1ZK10_9ARAC
MMDVLRPRTAKFAAKRCLVFEIVPSGQRGNKKRLYTLRGKRRSYRFRMDPIVE